MQHKKDLNKTWPWPVQLFLLALAVGIMLWASGCTTLTKSGMTPESKAKDRYECEREAYQAANGAPGLLSNGLYRDCMRARGYR